MDAEIVGDVVAPVLIRGRHRGRQPDAVHPQPLQVVQAGDHPAQVAVTVAIGIPPGADVDLVQGGALPPARPLCRCVHGPPHRDGPSHEWPDLNSLPSRRRLDPVSPYVVLVGVILLPTAVGYGVIALFRGIRWAGERDWSRRGSPEPEPIERLTANLRRLRVQLEDMETRRDLPAKHLRLQALR